MMDWINSLSTIQQIFILFAAIGSVLFLIRMIMLFIGMGDDGDAGDMDGGDGDVDMDHGDGDMDHADSDASFSLLSFQGLTAFFMMFGYVGFAMSRGSGYGIGLSLGAGTAAGLLTVWIVQRLFNFFSKMQNSGTMNLNNAIGQEGTVYLNIDENKPGKVRVTVQGHLKVMEAISLDGKSIPTDSRVKVVKLVNANVLVVEKI